MNLRERIKVAWKVLAAFEGAKQKPGMPRITGGVRDARKDYDPSNRKDCQKWSRWFAQNSGLYSSLRELFVQYVAGGNLAINPASRDAQWNQFALEYWNQWAQFADLSSRQSYSSLTGLVCAAWFQDGEVFKLWANGDTGQPRVQLIEAHRCETPPEHSKREGETVVDGVELDPIKRRPVAYWIKETKDGENTYRPITAEVMQHVFEPDRVGQYRGYPFVAPVLQDLLDLEVWERLETSAAHQAARVANVLITPTGEVSAENIMVNGGSITVGADGAVTAQIESLGGDTVVFKDGTKFEQFRSDRPSVVTIENWRRKEEKVCAGVSIPRVMVYPDSMQGTVYRGSIEMAAAYFRARFAYLAEYIRRDYRHVMEYAIRTDARLARNVPADWFKVDVHPPRAPNVDIGYNSAATIAELAAGLTTYSEHYAQRGLDWRDQFKALQEQNAMAESMGIKQKPQPQQQQKAQA